MFSELQFPIIATGTGTCNKSLKTRLVLTSTGFHIKSNLGKYLKITYREMCKRDLCY